jgi:hypothetical protein
MAANGQYRGQDPKVSRSDSGLTAPSSAAASDVVKGYLKEKRTRSPSRKSTAAGTARSTCRWSSPSAAAGLRRVRQGHRRRQRPSDELIDNTVDDNASITRTSLTSGAALEAALGHRYGNGAVRSSTARRS